MGKLGSYGGAVELLVAADGGEADERDAAAEETMMLWALHQPTLCRHNAFVSHTSLQLRLDACGSSLAIHQSPSSLSTPGSTGSVVWDSGIILAEFLEHSMDSGHLNFHGKNVVELGSGCGLVGCVAALLGARVVLTDLPDRLRLLKKNVESNVEMESMRGGSATVAELIWGDEIDPVFINPRPDFVLASDVIYDENAVEDLIVTLVQLCDVKTTIIISAELRNDSVLEYFLERVIKIFVIGRVEQEQWHPDYRSKRIVLYALAKRHSQ